MAERAHARPRDRDRGACRRGAICRAVALRGATRVTGLSVRRRVQMVAFSCGVMPLLLSLLMLRHINADDGVERTSLLIEHATIHLAPEWAGAKRARVAAQELLLAELRRKGVRRWELATKAETAQCAVESPLCVNLRRARDHAEVAAACGDLTVNQATVASEESFALCVSPHNVTVVAHTTRGLMLAAGRLLRELQVQKVVNETNHVALVPADLQLFVAPPPWATMRGHQLTDWGFYMTDAVFEQFVKDLIIFGTNQIEFAHITYSRGDAESLVRFSKICDKYGVYVSMFQPEWPSNATEAVFATMARIDAVLHEGGGGPVTKLQQSPSHNSIRSTTMQSVLQNLEAVATAVRQHHPNATVWWSPAGETASWMNTWYAALESAAVKRWLTGVSWGPVILGSETMMLARLPEGYKVRLYPDICHTLTAMYPVPDWSFVWANTHGRQVVNPLPRHYADVIAMNTNASLRLRAIGFGAYSEGAADDFNKALWSALYMEPGLNVDSLTAQYSRHFLKPVLPSVRTVGSSEGLYKATSAEDDDGAALLYGLEANWVGDARTNNQVLPTVTIADRLFKTLGNDIDQSDNWRLQSHLMRAYFDGYVQARAQFEWERENAAKGAIAAALAETGDAACSTVSALKELTRTFDHPDALRWRARAYQLACAINASASLCGGCRAGGMAVLESQNPSLSLSGFTLDGESLPGFIDAPAVSDTVFLRSELTNISRLNSRSERCWALTSLINWTDPGPGGFYDELGGLPRSTRLERGFGPAADPQYTFAPLIQFDEDYTRWPMTTHGSPQRIAWHRYAQTYGDHPLVLRYTNLDPGAAYNVSLVYAFAGFEAPPLSSLIAVDGSDVADYETRGQNASRAILHDFMPAPSPTRRISFAIPAAITRNGNLRLECHQPPGAAQNGNGRGCQIAEVWLARTQPLVAR